MSGKSETPTPYAVTCVENILGNDGCGHSFLTWEEYNRQMLNASKTWQCPICGNYDAIWDDENYERYFSPPDWLE